MAQRDNTKIKRKGRKVLAEFRDKKLRSSSGEKVKNRDQALAIAFSEQRRANKRRATSRRG